MNHQRGFALLAVYAVVITVTILSVVLFARHRSAVQATERYQNKILAFNAAESGIDFVLKELATNSQLRSQTETQSYTSAYTSMDRNEFRFTVSPVTGQSSLRRIDSEGCAPDCNSSSRAYQASNITVYCQITTPPPAPSVFQYGVYAGNFISMSGSKIAAFDSYNSSQGAYGGSNVSSDGGIAINSIGADTLVLQNTTIKGDVFIGNTGDPDTVLELQKATITGTVSTLPSDWSVPPPAEVPEGAVEIDLSNVTNTRTLAAGIYQCSSLHLSGQGMIVTEGPVEIYVSGSIDITGQGITVPDNHPGNLLIFSTSSANVTIAGKGSFIGGIYAPNSTVTVTGNGDLFGAVIAGTFNQAGNGAIHFDLSMKEDQTVDPDQTNIVRITAWQELHSLAWGTGQIVT